MTNSDKKKERNQFSVPDLPLLMTPKLDKVWEAESSKGVKSHDQQLLRAQAYFLDATGPLAEILEAINLGQQLSIDQVEERVKAALNLLGNASSQMSTLRRLKVIGEYDKDLIAFCQTFLRIIKLKLQIYLGQSSGRKLFHTSLR